MTATIGARRRKLRSNSSASATRYSLVPRRAPVPRARTRPPTITVGSRPPSTSTAPTREVVVVLPWVPATATPYLRRMISASISARRTMLTLSRRASTTSTLSRGTAEE